MSRLHWSEDAEADLDEITEYVALDGVVAAAKLRDAIERRLAAPADHPKLGRRGRVRGTREMVLGGTRFIGVYRRTGGDVIILRILHGARQWPPSETR